MCRICRLLGASLTLRNCGLLVKTAGHLCGLLGRCNPCCAPVSTSHLAYHLCRDPTGYSWHGDFQNGWDTTALQNAIDHCNNPNDATGQGDTSACSFLTLQSSATANECKISSLLSEDVQGPMARLPGCNPMQAGPGDATLYSTDNCPV